MVVSTLPNARSAHPQRSAGSFCASLVHLGLISRDTLAELRLNAAERGLSPEDLLISRRILRDELLYPAMARHYAMPQIVPLTERPDPRLIDRIGAETCLRERLLPWRNAGGAVVVAAPSPGAIEAHRERLEAALGPIIPALCPAEQIADSLMDVRGAVLREPAETGLDERFSCRNWQVSYSGDIFATALLLILSALLLWPFTVLAAISVWAIVSLILCMGLKLAAAIAAHRAPPPEPDAPLIARLPVVSVIVALYREADIAARLVERLARLDYPADRLEIVLAVEERDQLTRNALRNATLPDWMRIVVTPHGALKTKPRALNFALRFCRGSIIGVYDAEDAPDPNQIRDVVRRFHSRGPEVACLQGVLDYYNPRTNWLARCFTVEYATLFRVILPGIQRMGLAIPLGGTTLFVRREALEKAGAWDAHNVTEDADLGIRLHRMGYRTEVLPTVTHEEANCRPLAWIKQRSRWQKGYMMTWCVHMRRPRELMRQLGPRAFLGFQIMFLCALSQVLLAPVLWSFWLLSLGVPHPFTDALPQGSAIALIGMFLLTEAINITLGVLANRRTGHGMSSLWVPTLILYYPLATISAYKALWEMVAKPFYWDKTSHGHFDQG